MHKSLEEIPLRILDSAKGALSQANTHAIFHDPYYDYWDAISVVNTALAGELFLKAVIAMEHPLLIFRDFFHLNDDHDDEIDIERIIEKGRTYNFEHLPKLLWVATGERLEDSESFEALRSARNSIQHFCVPEKSDLRRISLEFIYKNIDPIIERHFGLCAIEFHEDFSVGYDYIVSGLISRELLFSIPDNFSVGEINLEEELSKTSQPYRAKFIERLSQKGLSIAKCS